MSISHEAFNNELYGEVADAFVEELQDAVQGESLLLELNLTRALAIVPGDVTEAAEAVGGPVQLITSDNFDIESQSLKVNVIGDVKTPISAYILLVSAVIGLSSIGPLLQMQNNVDALMKVFWRMSATAMTLLPFAVRSMLKEGYPRLNSSQVLSLILTAAAYAFMCAAFVISLKYTSMGNAVIFSNSQSLILLIAKFLVGETVLVAEAAGAVVAFSGAALCSKDSAGSSPDGADFTIYGDALALLSAISGVWYLVLAKTVRTHVRLHVFMFLIMAVGSALILLCMVLLLSSEVSFDRNFSHGVWGWINLEADRLPLELVMVLACNLIGAMGYVKAMHYFDTLVISVAALLEPIVAELTAFALGVGFLPGLMGWIGNGMVLLGTVAVVLPTVTKSNSSAVHKKDRL